MDSTLLASLILGGAMIVAAVTIAVAFSRGRSVAVAQRGPSAPTTGDARGDGHAAPEPHDHAPHDQPREQAPREQARRDPEWRKRDETMRDALEALARRVSRLEADRSPRSPSAPTMPSANGEAPLSVHPPIPTAPSTIVEPAPPLRRTRDDMASEVRRLLARGRNAVEIAQMLDADVGEVELVLQLDRAATGRVRHPDAD